MVVCICELRIQEAETEFSGQPASQACSGSLRPDEGLHLPKQSSWLLTAPVVVLWPWCEHTHVCTRGHKDMLHIHTKMCVTSQPCSSPTGLKAGDWQGLFLIGSREASASSSDCCLFSFPFRGRADTWVSLLVVSG